jgi:hypothetical protein
LNSMQTGAAWQALIAILAWTKDTKSPVVMD